MKQSYLNLVHSITKNAAVATLVMLLMLGTVGTSAAQLVAPEEYKPLSLAQKVFNKNGENSSDSQNADNLGNASQATPLLADNGYDVAVLEKCDLAVRFTQTVTRQSEFKLTQQQHNFDDPEFYEKALSPLQYLSYFGGEGSGPGAGFSLQCYDKAMSLQEFDEQFIEKTNPDGSLFSTSIPGAEDAKKENLNKDQFCFETGLTPISCEQDITNLYRIEVPGMEVNDMYYFMNYKDKTYLLEKGRYATRGRETLTLQFDSLAPSKATVEVDNISKPDVPVSSSTPSSTSPAPVQSQPAISSSVSSVAVSSSQSSSVTTTPTSQVEQPVSFNLVGDCKLPNNPQAILTGDCQLVDQSNKVVATIPLCGPECEAGKSQDAALGKFQNGKQYILEKVNLEGGNAKMVKIYQYDSALNKLANFTSAYYVECNMSENPHLREEQKIELKKAVDLYNSYATTNLMIYDLMVNSCV